MFDNLKRLFRIKACSWVWLWPPCSGWLWIINLKRSIRGQRSRQVHSQLKTNQMVCLLREKPDWQKFSRSPLYLWNTSCWLGSTWASHWPLIGWTAVFGGRSGNASLTNSQLLFLSAGSSDSGAETTWRRWTSPSLTSSSSSLTARR